METTNTLKTNQETKAIAQIANLFDICKDSTQDKLANFPKYITRQKLTRLLAQYEIFKKIVPIKGSIVECGVYKGSSLMTWALLSAVLEPNNFMRKIYGFDSFEGLPKTKEFETPESYEELLTLISCYDNNRFLGHIPKVEIIKGQFKYTVNPFLESHKHLLISLLFLDFDLYEPTYRALISFHGLMPKGSIIAFDELDNKKWEGETQAMLKFFSNNNNYKIERVEFDPCIGYITL